VRHKIRSLALIGLSVAAVSVGACSSPAEQAQPVWAGSVDSVAPTTAPVTTPGTAAGEPAAVTSITPTKAPAAKPTVTPKAKPKVTVTPKVKARYVFPVIGNSSYAHTHHDYAASDVMTNCGNKFVAVTSGVVLATQPKDIWKRKVNAGATRGGLSVSILGVDGVRYYGSHLSKIQPGIKPGAKVTAGQLLGRTGDTGDASACHLHFGISPPCAKKGDWWLQRGTIYPWPYLDSWRKGGQKSPVAKVNSWHAQHGCPSQAQIGA
jgi:peptidoglycan LD-endopeptidase LytH